MAFSLLVELAPQKADWESINNDLKRLAEEFIEFFPVPNFIITGKNYIGISVLNRKMDITKIEVVENVIKYLVNAGHKVFELYNQNEFLESNIEALVVKFLKSK